MAQLVVSPTGGDRPLADAAEVDATFEPPLPQQQRDASAWASANLGPDRKVFVDLTDAAHKEVDWRKVRGGAGDRQRPRVCRSADRRLPPPLVPPPPRQLSLPPCPRPLALSQILKERGMQKPAKQSREQADPAAGDDALLLRVRRPHRSCLRPLLLRSTVGGADRCGPVARGAALSAPPPLLHRLQGRSGRQENTWTRMIAKLESTFCVRA